MKKFLLFLLINLPILGYGQSWSGDLDKFESSDGYWMMNGADIKETLHLQQSYELPPNTTDWQWEFSLYFEDKPTDDNWITIYPIQGIDFYFHAGKDGHDDLFKFFVGGKEVAFTFQKYKYSNTELTVYITLTESRYWNITLNLHDFPSKEKESQSEQVDMDIKMPTSATFDVEMHHSSSRPKGFGISEEIKMGDNITIPEDPEEPEISDVTCKSILPLSPDEVQYEFTGNVNIDNAIFSISGEGFENKEKAIRQIHNDYDLSIVKVRYPKEMTLDKVYRFYWENIKDEEDFPIQDDFLEGTFSLTEKPEDPEEEEKPEQPTSGIIRINEVMANPNGFDPETEYIELYNTSNKSISLDGWTIKYESRKTEMILDGLEIPPSDYIVLYDKDNQAISCSNAYPIDGLSPLANTGKTLILKDASGTSIDEYTYPNCNKTPGISWEYSETGWHFSSDERGGTPGEPNSEGDENEEEEEPEPDEPEKEEPEEEEPEEEEKPNQPSGSFSPGDIRINEIMANPKGFEPKTEYIELYNSLEEEVQLKDWILQYGSTKIALDEVSIEAHGYIVLYRTGDEGFDLPSSSVCALDKFPANLANDGKSLTLLYYTDVIDQYTYPEAKEGKSWEYAPEGWHVCSDPSGGTPGKANSDGIEEEEEEQPDEPEEEEEPNQPELPSSPIELGAIRINEVMADPKGLEELPETEYIELYNVSDEALVLTGCTLVYNDRTKVALDGISFPAHTFAVLYRSGREMSLTSGIDCPVDKFPTLANAGEKSLVLYNHKGNVIDQYTYPKAKAGKSWEYAPEGWHLSSDPRGGTPGEVNSDGIPSEEEEDKEDEDEKEEDKEPENPNLPHPTQGEIIINEILPEPFPDGSEYIELFNRSERDLSLADVCISTRKSDGSLNTVYPLSDYKDLLESGGYLLISKSLDGVRAFYDVSDESHTLECKLPVLANTGASIVLYRISSKMIIDEVTYSPKWHSVPSSKRKGVALERIDPAGASQSASNWTSAASVADYGTPGRPNSQYAEETDATGNESISIQKIQPSGPYAITYRLDKPGYSARGWVFDIIGRKTALLVDNESLGTAGTIEWNGHALNGNPVEKGVYIMYLELWHPDGDILRKKAAFLVY